MEPNAPMPNATDVSEPVGLTLGTGVIVRFVGGDVGVDGVRESVTVGVFVVGAGVAVLLGLGVLVAEGLAVGVGVAVPCIGETDGSVN